MITVLDWEKEIVRLWKAGHLIMGRDVEFENEKEESNE